MLLFLALGLTLVVSARPTPAQSSGRFQLVRSASGSKGAPDGSRFILEDPRTAFQAGKDRQVLVTFEWQGPPGRHRCEGAWKDPSGRTVFTSEAEVNARGTRFGVYWGLSLPDTVATGNWVVETRVDGEPAGVHVFQVQTDPAAAPAAPARQQLSVAELYQHGLRQTLTLHALDSSGAVLGTTSGFFVGPDLVSTSLAGINAARLVRLDAPEHERLETSEVVSWNRRHDWAILRFAGSSAQPVERAARPPSVGDRCFFLDAQGRGARVIVETSVIGQALGEFTLGDVASEASHGSPVFNEYGETVGALSGSGVLGATTLDLHGLGEPTRRPSRGARARVLAPVATAHTRAQSLQDLEMAGVFVRPLVATPHFVSGVLGTGVERQGRIPVAANQRLRFARADARCVAFVTWVPSRKQDSTTHFELFDEDGRRLAASEPRKARLRSGESFVQYWEFELAALRPGIHRIDVLLGPDPVWRTYFSLSE